MEAGFVSCFFLLYRETVLHAEEENILQYGDMWGNDLSMVFTWWGTVFLFGAAAYPLTHRIFHRWYDGGYALSKAVGFALVPFLLYFFGTFRILPFTTASVFAALALVFSLPVLFLLWRNRTIHSPKKVRGVPIRPPILILIFEEFLFLACLVFWAWIKAHEPAIRGLEKFMDYGFMQTIINSRYFPVPDMWWAGGTINYYYFGHLVTAVLTKASGLPLSVTFNLMLATLFSLCFTMSFTIGKELFLRNRTGESDTTGLIKIRGRVIFFGSTIVGLITGWFVTLAGNMQTIYAFTKGYTGEDVVPFWTVLWNPSEFFSRVSEGMARYWYANATRFIPYTIHEFPSYSFVVSDIHGHVLSIPFALLAIALLIELFSSTESVKMFSELGAGEHGISALFTNPITKTVLLYGFLVAVLLMTNAFDGPIYALIFAILLAGLYWYPRRKKRDWWVYIETLVPLGMIGVVAACTALPFLMHFSSFATGIGVNCPPSGLENSTFGPFVFEGLEKCQKSPIWMMWLLWGFFWFSGAALFIPSITKRMDVGVRRFLKILYLYGIVMIIIPEFFYAKDIYPAHFRSNTMFKLGYQAFMMWSIVSVQTMASVIVNRNRMSKHSDPNRKKSRVWYSRIVVIFSSIPPRWVRGVYLVLLVPQVVLVSIFPFFAIRSYFGELKTYVGLDGLGWFKSEYPDDYAAMVWLRDSVVPQYHWDGKNPAYQLPSIVEADGESYTDNNRISAFAGVPTIVGWAVHEWLWRGSYDLIAPPREDVRQIYESGDVDTIRSIGAKYHIRYIVVGPAEREKFTNLHEDIFAQNFTIAHNTGQTILYSL